MQIVADPSERTKLQTTWNPDTYLPQSHAIEYLLLDSMLNTACNEVSLSSWESAVCIFFSANADLGDILRKQKHTLPLDGS